MAALGIRPRGGRNREFGGEGRGRGCSRVAGIVRIDEILCLPRPATTAGSAGLGGGGCAAGIWTRLGGLGSVWIAAAAVAASSRVPRGVVTIAYTGSGGGFPPDRAKRNARIRQTSQTQQFVPLTLLFTPFLHRKRLDNGRSVIRVVRSGR